MLCIYSKYIIFKNDEHHKRMNKLGYARGSTSEQNLDLQKDILLIQILYINPL